MDIKEEIKKQKEKLKEFENFKHYKNECINNTKQYIRLLKDKLKEDL